MATSLLGIICISLIIAGVVSLDVSDAPVPSECVKKPLKYQTFDLKSHHREDLKCPVIDEFIGPMCTLAERKICSCFSKPKWSLLGPRPGDLFIEYISLTGDAKIVSESLAFSIFRLHHPHGYLSSLPENICDFTEIVELNLSFNKIKEICNMTCLKSLSTVDFSHNRISKISFYDFHGLEKLHDVNLSHNNIKTIDPRTFAKLGIQFLDLSHNNLYSVDFTNLFVPKSFCIMSFMNNHISRIVNQDNIDVDRVHYNLGDGFLIDLRNNMMSYLPRPKTFGLKAYHEYGQLVFNRYSMDMHGNRIFCDCQLAKLLRALYSDPKELADKFNIYGSGNGFFCTYPKNLQGFSIEKDIIKKNRLDLLICQLNTTECPKGCDCYFQPYFNRSVIDCVSKWIGNELPDFDVDMLMMDTNDGEPTQFELLFQGNNITKLHLDNRSYAQNITRLDISFNKLQSIRDVEISSLPRDCNISLRNNFFLTRIPKTFKNMNPNNIDFFNCSIDCNCEVRRWLVSWLQGYQVNSSDYALKCKIKGNVYSIADLDSEDCEEDENFPLIVCGMALFSLLLVLIYLYREYYLYVYVFYRRRKTKTLNGEQSGYENDAYISMLGTDEMLQKYISSEFLPMLEEKGYNVHYPLRDNRIGHLKEEELLRNLLFARTYIFFLTSITESQRETFEFLEWIRAWEKYRANFQRNIILINYDFVRPSQVEDKRLRASVVMGNSIDISDTRICEKVVEYLGKPMIKPIIYRTCVSKPKMDISQLYV